MIINVYNVCWMLILKFQASPESKGKAHIVFTLSEWDKTIKWTLSFLVNNNW